MVITKLNQTFAHLHEPNKIGQEEGVQEARQNFAKRYPCPPVVFARSHFVMLLASAFALGVTFGIILVRTALKL